MKTPILIVSILALISFSCSKTIDCDNAQLCVVNTGSDTLDYCWNCDNNYDEKLAPGAKTCLDFGPVHQKEDEFVIVAYFNNYAIEVTECYTEKEMN